MTIQELSVNATLGEVQSIPELQEVAPYLLSWGTDGAMFYTAGGGERSKYLPGWPIRDMSGVGWNPESVLDGIRYLYETAKKGNYFHKLYSGEECQKDPLKAVANITLFRSTQKTKKPCVIILPGGTYANVCSLTEGYPVAKAFNQLGYNAVILNYRTGKNALLPDPMEDLAAAIRYLQTHEEELDLYAQEYIVTGFSAGGHLCAEWGTENHGYIHYGCPGPVALFPIYPVISTKALAKPEDNAVVAMLYEKMFGENAMQEIMESYNVDSHVTDHYPPCFIACCADDDCISPLNSKILAKALQDKKVPVQLRIYEKGGHGFGTGEGTDAWGWISEAVRFYETQRELLHVQVFG